MDIRDKIEKLRLTRNWSLSKLAREIGISETSAYNWYNENHSMPTVDTLQNICDLFEISMSELFYDGEMDKLSGRQMTAMQLFSKLTPQQQDAFIEILKTYNNKPL